MTKDEMAGWFANSMDMSLSELPRLVMDREAWHAVIHGQGGLACCDSWGHKELDTIE